MAITLATGTQVNIASSYGASVAMTAVSNSANSTTSANATLASSHGVIVGDFLELSSGWDPLHGRIVRVSAVSTNDVTLESVFTNNTTTYPPGSGTGSIRRITAWLGISQITASISVSGGEQQFADVTTLTDSTQKQIPTVRSPVQVTLPVYDDPALAWYATVRTASEGAIATAMRMIFPNGSRLVANAYWSLQQVPTIEDSTLRASIALSFVANPTRYAT
jgi:hypothetical protein